MDKWVMSYYVHYSLDNVTWEKAYDKETGNMVRSIIKSAVVYKMYTLTQRTVNH